MSTTPKQAVYVLRFYSDGGRAPAFTNEYPAYELREVRYEAEVWTDGR